MPPTLADDATGGTRSRLFRFTPALWRPAWFLLLTLGVLAPLTRPIAVAFTSWDEPLLREFPRISHLLGQTVALTLLTALFALPLGAGLAIVLTRFPILGQRLLWGLVLLGLFLPLSTAAVAWQVILGSWLPPLQSAPGTVAWRPWNQGLLPAAFVHAMSALPWVVSLITLVLRSTDRNLEELARLQGCRQLWRYILFPQLRIGLLAAFLWLVVQTSTEIPITDAMMVRTFAEEVYTQFVSASAGLGRAMLITLPALLFGVALLLLGFRRLKTLPLSVSAAWHPVQPFRLSRSTQLALSGVVWLIAVCCFLLPVLALVWKAGGADHRQSFAPDRVRTEFLKVLSTDGLILVKSLGVAVAIGIVTTSLAWISMLLARGSRSFTYLLLVLGVVLAITPGPILGVGLKELIQKLVQLEAELLALLGWSPGFAPLRSLLYDQPSPVPAGWACVLRLLPVAWLFAATALRLIPQPLWDLAALDGLGLWRKWRVLIGPYTGGLASRCVLLVAALSLGEVSASKLVNPPFYSNFILRLFDQMHYGADSTVSALGLLQLTASMLLAGLWLVLTLEREPYSNSNPKQ